MISHVMTLANGIIGVSVLAMPFCFKQCGIILATLVLLVSSILSRLSCHFLIKSAVMSRRRNFEFLAFHAFGPMGKFLVELCIIGFLLGTCIAFFVVVGDLGPQIVGEMINKTPEDIRTSFLITAGFFIVLPLGLLRNIDSLASVSIASIAFYIFLVFRVVLESAHHIFAADWFDKVYYWRPGGILQCLPIFALALFCQTQLFEIYEAVPNATLEKMNQVVKGALNICTSVYFCVGFFGYVAFCNQPITGNILMSFEPSLTSQIIKIGFVLSVAFSFPLVIFPCRASLNSLLFRRGYAHETSTSYITETRFRCLTTFIVMTALTVGVLIPNIEFVLGIVGSTMGVVICLIFPAAFFVSISTKNTNERLLAQLIIITGIWILVLGTYANLYALEKSSNLQAAATTVKLPSQMNNMAHMFAENDILMKPEEPKKIRNSIDMKDGDSRLNSKVPNKPPDDENARQEPPVPVERISETEQLKNSEKKVFQEPPIPSSKIETVHEIHNVDSQLIEKAEMAYNNLKKIKETNELPESKVQSNIISKKENENSNNNQKNDVIAVDAIKKEESELAADKEMANADSVQRREQLEKTLEKHIMEQKEMMEEQKKLLKDIEEKKKELQLAEQTKINHQQNQENREKGNVQQNQLSDLNIENKVNEHIKEQNEIMKQQKELIEDIKEKKEELKLVENVGKEQPKFENVEVNNNLPDDSKKPVKNNDQELKNSKNGNDRTNIKVPDPIISNNKELVENVKTVKNEDLKRKEKAIYPDEKENIEHVKKGEAPNKDNLNKNSFDSKGPIIRALTKQTNEVVANGHEDIPKKEQTNDNILDDKKSQEKMEKNKEYSIPIVLKMSNQTKRTPDLNSSQINKTKSNVAGLTRDILEEHQREKRMIEVEQLESSNKANNTKNEDDIGTATEKNVDKEEICTKKINDSGIENDFEKVNSKESSENLIKMSEHLSEQDVMKDVSIDSGLGTNGAFVKVQNRDLKSLEFENRKDET